MEIGEAVGRYEQAAALLPSRWQQAARRVPEHRKAQAEEFRLRAGRPMTLLTCEGELLVSDELPRQSVTQADLEQLCDAVTGYSRYAAAETMGKGYLIGRGGFRIGLCGTVAVRGDGGTALRDISSAVVRISRQVRGLWQEVPEWSAGGFDSTLIAAPPGGGKTTLLRDMIATLSNGTEDRCPLRVGVVDERGELAGMYRGVPQLDVGCHTDVLDGCPKALGIPMLLRSANPQVIAVDEITEAADILAMTAAANCGVKLLATIHAEDGEELRRKPLFRQLAEAGVFRRSSPSAHRMVGGTTARRPCDRGGRCGTGTERRHSGPAALLRTPASVPRPAVVLCRRPGGDGECHPLAAHAGPAAVGGAADPGALRCLVLSDTGQSSKRYDFTACLGEYLSPAFRRRTP